MGSRTGVVDGVGCLRRIEREHASHWPSVRSKGDSASSRVIKIRLGHDFG